MHRPQHPTTRLVLGALATLILMLSAGPATGEEFAIFGGKATVVWKTTLVLGGAVRNASQQSDLIGAGAGHPNPVTGAPPEYPGASGAVGVNDDSDLNFRKGEVVAMPMTLVSDARIQARTWGLFVRVRAWYDMALESGNVHHGSTTQGFTNNSRLSDHGFEGASAFWGADFYDTFFYSSIDVGSAKMLVRLGRQVVNWGEGIFYPGINQFNPVDVAWVSMPGATVINGAFLPVNRVYANFALPRGWSVDGFYNLEFRNTVLPGCGTWFSPVDNAMQPGCNVATAGGLRDDTAAALLMTPSYWGGKMPRGGYYYHDGLPDPPGATKKPDWQDSGWGIGVHTFLEPIRSELGFFYTRFTNPMNTVSTLPNENPAKLAVNNMWVEGVEAYAISLATGVRNVAIAGQVTRTLNMPAQRNFPHLIQGATQNLGPYADQANYYGKEYPGYFKADITDLQISGIFQIGQLLHLKNAQLIAESDWQWVTNFPGAEKERIGRYGNFGIATWNGGNCDPGPLENGVTNKCKVDGFGTDFAWGYKLRAQAVIPTARWGITLTPAVTLGQDIRGYSMTGNITGGRISWGAFLRADIKAKYFMEIGATGYRRDVTFDPQRDRGLYSFSMGVNLM